MMMSIRMMIHDDDIHEDDDDNDDIDDDMIHDGLVSSVDNRCRQVSTICLTCHVDEHSLDSVTTS